MVRLMSRIPRWWDWLPLTAIVIFLSYAAFDKFVPVVITHGTVINKAQDSVVINIAGWKIRECKYVSIQAYSIDKNMLRNSAVIQRVDMAEKATSHPFGKYNLGLWSIKPTTDAIGVVVYVNHACSTDDMRSTKLAEVMI